MTNIYCDYGCNQIAKFTTTSGRACCSKHYNSCPANKAKNTGRGKFTMPVGYIPHNKGLTFPELWKADFILNGKGNHKRVLIHERGHICESCKNTEWLGKPIAIELEHIDGDNKNNEKINLKLLCPNCHAQTSTYRGKNATRDTNKKVSDEDLLNAIQSTDNLRTALTSVGLVAKGGNYNRCYRLLRV